MAARAFRSEDANPLGNISKMIGGLFHDAGIPWNKPLNLVNILNVPAVVRTNDWKDVGLELGVEEYVLDIIDRDCLGRTNDCKREMFSYWLENDLHKSWEKVSCAVKTVKERIKEVSHEQEKNEMHIQKEKSRALEAVRQLKISLEMLNDTNTDIKDKCTKLAEELKEQNGKWDSFQTHWERDDTKWEEGAERRQQIREVLGAHNLKESQFVKHFLQEKELPVNLSDREVECHLRKYILEEEVEHSKQFRVRHQQVQDHHKELKYLWNELNECKKLAEEHLAQKYTKLVNLLEKELCLELKNLGNLERQLANFKKMLEECTAALKVCGQALAEAEKCLKNSQNQLEKFSETFSKDVRGMETVLKWLKNLLKSIVEKLRHTMTDGKMTDNEEFWERTLQNFKETEKDARHELEEVKRLIVV